MCTSFSYAAFFCAVVCASARTLLLLDPGALSSATNVSVIPGTPELLATYADGIGGGTYAGWGYPSVVRGPLSNGSAGYLMLYSACACAAPGCWGPNPLYTFLAESQDGVSWVPVIVPTAPPGAPPGALFVSGEVGSVLDDLGGEGVGVGERYKMLRTDTTIQVSDDAQHWVTWSHNWTSTGVDPGFHALRASQGSPTVLITARPQALRHLGRHAGVIVSPSGWAGLGGQLATPTQPLDGSLYRFTDQIYGLPGFDYASVLLGGEEGGNYIGFVWRLLAPNGETGWVTSALAYSRDGRAWAPAPTPPTLVPALMNDTDLPQYTYLHIPGSWPSPSAGAAACAAACRNDSASCAAWTYVSKGAVGKGAERCCLKRDVSTPVAGSPGVVSGIRPDLGQEGSAPLAALPPLFPLPTLPSPTSYRQFYPKSLLSVGGRLLIYASVSSTLHGESAPNASGISVYALRRDGFAAATGPLQGEGALVTAPLDWVGGEAALNVLCGGGGGGGGGGVRVAALQGGTPVVGYDLDQCDPAPPNCDELAWLPTWGAGARGLGSLAGLTLQLQVELTNGAQLFALRGSFSLWDSPNN